MYGPVTEWTKIVDGKRTYKRYNIDLDCETENEWIECKNCRYKQPASAISEILYNESLDKEESLDNEDEEDEEFLDKE